MSDGNPGPFAGGSEISESELDSLLQDYLIITELRVDPFGKVFRGRQTKSQQIVSIRIFPVPESQFPGGISAFTSYLASCAQYHHPHLADVLDYGATTAGHLFLVTKMAEQDLESATNLDAGTVQNLYGELLEVLGWLHGKGMPHGCVTPSHITFGETEGIKLDGLGLVGLAGSLGSYFNPAELAPYLAPESSQWGDATFQSDLYMTGVCLYRTLTGNLPQGMFEMPSQVNPHLAATWDELVATALQSNPNTRWDSTFRFQSALHAISTDLSSAGQTTAAARPMVAATASPKLNLKVEAVPASERQPASPSYVRTSPPASNGFPIGILIFSLVSLLGAIGFVYYVKQDNSKQKNLSEVTAETVPEAQPEENIPEPRGVEIDREARISGLLIDLRLLVPHCANIRAAVDRDQKLKTILVYSDSLNQIVVGSENEELVDYILSDELAEQVQLLVERARLTSREAPIRSGTLIAWGAQPDSESVASEALPNYQGPDTEIVSLAGTLSNGLALSSDGSLAHWGEEGHTLPETSDVTAIDCEGETYVALSGDGKVTAWGSEFSGSETTDQWSQIAQISAGKGYVLAVADDFQVLSAGGELEGETKIPAEVGTTRIVDAEGVGERRFAVSADGTVFQWGGNQPKIKRTVFAPYDIQSSGSNLYVQSLTGEILKYDRFGNKKEEDFGSETADLFIPRFSPDEKIFAYNRGASRWTLRNQSDLEIDLPYWQETARGAVDLLIGDEGFIAAVPRASSGSRMSKTEVTSAKESSIPLTSVAGIAIPEAAAYREWNPREGKPRRARLLDIKDGTHVTIRFTEGTEATVPMDRFSESDQEFIGSWRPLSEETQIRIREEAAHVSPETFIKQVGYERLDLSIRNGNPEIELNIDGWNAKLIVDTGATSTMLVTRLADRAGIRLGEQVQVLTWQGRVSAYLGTASKMKLGSAEFTNVEILAVDLNEAAFGSWGLLGIDLMRNARAALDFGNNQLLVRRPGNRAPEKETPPEYRSWRPKGRPEFRGRLVSIEGEQIKLETSEGKSEELDWEAILGPDREYLEAWQIQRDYMSQLAKRRASLDLGDVLAHDQSHWSELPVSMQNATQVIKVKLDGRELEFFVDTGAATSKLSIKAARELGRSVNNMEVVGSSGGIEGKQVPVFASEFGSFQIGDRIFHDYRMQVYDFDNMTANRFSGTSYDGVIGTDLLMRLRAIIDMDRNRILLPKE